jgi:hypothetical protein
MESPVSDRADTVKPHEVTENLVTFWRSPDEAVFFNGARPSFLYLADGAQRLAGAINRIRPSRKPCEDSQLQEALVEHNILVSRQESTTEADYKRIDNHAECPQLELRIQVDSKLDSGRILSAISGAYEKVANNGTMWLTFWGDGVARCWPKVEDAISQVFDEKCSKYRSERNVLILLNVETDLLAAPEALKGAIPRWDIHVVTPFPLAKGLQKAGKDAISRERAVRDLVATGYSPTLVTDVTRHNVSEIVDLARHYADLLGNDVSFAFPPKSPFSSDGACNPEDLPNGEEYALQMVSIYKTGCVGKDGFPPLCGLYARLCRPGSFVFPGIPLRHTLSFESDRRYRLEGLEGSSLGRTLTPDEFNRGEQFLDLEKLPDALHRWQQEESMPCPKCPLRFICGGLSHRLQCQLTAEKSPPYLRSFASNLLCGVRKALIEELVWELVESTTPCQLGQIEPTGQLSP